VQTGAVHLDVTITPVPGGRVLIDVREIPPEPSTPPSEESSLRALDTAMREAE
jgi:hypothetical protein